MTTPTLLKAAIRLLVVAFALTVQARPVLAGTEQSRLDRILDEKRVRVCIWPDYYGISFRDPRTQELRGIDIDMAMELGRELNVSVDFVDSSFARLIDDVRGDHCDVAMFAVGITPARAEKLRFTAPHLASDIYAITTRSNRRVQVWDDIDRPGIVVAVAKGTLHESVMGNKLRHARLAVLASPHAREQEVESGRADVFMTDFPYSLRMLQQSDWARLIKPASTYHITPYAWALAPGDERWHQRLESFLASAKRDGRLMNAAKRHGLESIVVTQ